MLIGLTGGIACGKSTVANMLVDRGAALIDADLLAREVVEPGQPALEQIRQTFGEDMLLPDGTLDRKRLGSIVFADEGRRRQLEQIIHPQVRRLMLERIQAAGSASLIVVDVPLLYESGMESMFEAVMVVYVPEWMQLERLMQRDQLSEEEAWRRIRAQMPIEEKRQRADIVIDNSGTIEETERQLDEWWQSGGRS